jgi:hypothetical protein
VEGVEWELSQDTGMLGWQLSASPRTKFITAFGKTRSNESNKEKRGNKNVVNCATTCLDL